MQWHGNRHEKRRRTRVGPALALLAALAAPAAAQEGGGEAPAVGLDQLLKLPRSHEVKAETRRFGGATRPEWQTRFRRANEDLANAKKALRASQEELKGLAAESSAWKVSAPGGAGPSNTGDSPLNYKLSQQLRRDREEVERAERTLRELQIEADLAGVPKEWVEAGATPKGPAPR